MDIYYDIQSFLYLVRDQMYHEHTKHVDISITSSDIWWMMVISDFKKIILYDWSLERGLLIDCSRYSTIAWDFLKKDLFFYLFQASSLRDRD